MKGKVGQVFELRPQLIDFVSQKSRQIDVFSRVKIAECYPTVNLPVWNVPDCFVSREDSLVCIKKARDHWICQPTFSIQG